MIFQKYICCCICIFLLSCNNKGAQANTSTKIINNQETIADDTTGEDIPDKYPVVLESDTYSATIQKGVYTAKSIDEQYIRASNNIIAGNRFADTTFISNRRLMYLANEEPIALFNNRYPTTKRDVAGIFEGGSLVEVDTVFYNTVYADSDETPMSFNKWYSLNGVSLTYDVWYAIKINGKKYYTDYKLHDNIEYSRYLLAKEQILLIYAQDTGYDGLYDRGYPDFYEVIVLGKSSAPEVWEQIYRSPKLDLNDSGMDEYGISEYLIDNDPEQDSQGNFLIELPDLCKLTWTGENLIINMNKNE